VTLLGQGLRDAAADAARSAADQDHSLLHR